FTHSGRTFHSGEFLTFPAGDADWSITLQSRGAPTPSGAAIRASYRGARIGGSSAPLPELVPNRPHRFKVSVQLLASQKAKIRCELDGTPCFDGEKSLPKLPLTESSRLQDGAIILCANVDRPSDATIFHAIRLRMNAGSACPLADVAGYKLGIVEAQ